jgi:Holliday junction resolvase RusA-like endonuclease
MSSVVIEGQPLAIFVFDFVPSWNQVINVARAHWSKGHGQTKTWRESGYNLAHKYMTRFFPGRKRLIKQRALVIVKVFRGSEKVYDIHNVCLKHLADGFTDAGIWKDDDWATVPMVIFMWAENVPMSEQRIEIEIHELSYVTISGKMMRLPAGRIIDIDFLFKGR